MERKDRKILLRKNLIAIELTDQEVDGVLGVNNVDLDDILPDLMGKLDYACKQLGDEDGKF